MAALAVRPLGLSRLIAVCGGAALLGTGLVGLALLPSASVGFMVWSLALCGAGLGLAVRCSRTPRSTATLVSVRSGTLTVGARHVGLVLALALIAPLLASKVPTAGDQALLRGTAVLLDAPIGLDKKVPVALDLRKAFARAQAGETPDLKQPFNAHGAASDSALAAVRDDLAGAIETTITRALAAGLLPLRRVRRAGADRGRRLPPEDRMKPAAWIVTALLLSGAVLVGVELGKGALAEPSPKIADPCQPRAGRTGGIDATIQRIVLDGLDGAACRLHTTREELALSARRKRAWAARAGGTRIRSRSRCGQACCTRSTRPSSEGTCRGFLAPALRGIVERAPLGKLVRGGISLQDQLG